MMTLLHIEGLKVVFDTQRGRLQALGGIDLTIQEGEIFGIVGETGCGKSVLGQSVLRLIPRPGHITAGQILFRGEDLLTKRESEMRRIRGGSIAMIFQDPATSLNPIFQVGSQLMRVLRQHHPMSRRQAHDRLMETLDAVGLPDAERILKAYPHELSGGMQQRVMIAMALICQPALLIADEPTTALDVTIQAQILRLLRDLRDRMGIAIILITHDIGVVAQTCDRMAVLYAGRVAEIGQTADVLTTPQHPYTRGLMAAVPQPELRGQKLMAIAGTVPSNPGAIKGCAFASRCPVVMEHCREESPTLYPINQTHSSACFLAKEGVPHAR